jgi:HSP20 family protein
MTMQRWDPFNDTLSLRQVMDRLLEDAFVWPGRTTGGAGQSGFGVPVDVEERENELVVKASLPGIRPEEVNLTVQGNTLIIDGETREEHEQPQGQSNGQQGQGNGHKAQ